MDNQNIGRVQFVTGVILAVLLAVWAGASYPGYGFAGAQRFFAQGLLLLIGVIVLRLIFDGLHAAAGK